MSYEPLHHKYRPQTFADLVGQEAIATTLTNAILSERIAPAYLFTGSRGTGKTSSARILAKSLNCLKGDKPTEQPCGLCDVCQGIVKGSTMDVMEIDAASNTGVDNIREIIEGAQFAPVQCRYKVYCIDECHMLSTQAFNALLKTLEEPPARVVFVLATTDPQRVLPTIISRCQRFDFRRIPLQAMVKHLKEIAKKENISITDEAITLISQVAQGGLRDAESLLDQLSLLAEEVSVERVWDLVGAVPERDLMELLNAIASGNPDAILEKARSLMDRGREPLIVLQNLAGFYRDLLIAKTAPSRSDLVAMTAPTWKALRDFVPQWEISTILAGQKHLKDSEVQIKNTTQPRLWLEVTLLGLLASATNTQSVEASPIPVRISTPPRDSNSKNRVSPPRVEVEAQETKAVGAEAKRPEQEILGTEKTDINSSLPSSTPTPVPQPVKSVNRQSEVAAQSPVAATSELEQVWQQLLANLPLPSKALLSEHGRLLAVSDGQARIGIRSPKLIEYAKSKLPHVEAALLKILNRNVKVSLEVKTAAESNVAAEEQRSRGVSIDANNTATLPKPQNAQNGAKSLPHFHSPPSPEATEAKEQKSISSSNPPALSVSEASVFGLAIPKEIAEQASRGSEERIELTHEEPVPEKSASAPQVSNWEADEVAIAAASLAEFFKTDIIKLNDDFENDVATQDIASPLPEPTATQHHQLEKMIASRPQIEIDDDDEDIPF